MARCIPSTGRPLLLAVALLWYGWITPVVPAASSAREESLSRPEVTFSGRIAGIVHDRCAPCHREGQAAPFNLLTFEDVRRRARVVREAIESRTMPPWLAEPGHGEFLNERRLLPEELQAIRDWMDAGMPEGDPAKTPSPPKWPAGWQEGTPDLVVAMPQPFELGPDGPDVYRHFALRVPVDRDRWVRAVEFAPGNPRVVHHAFIRLDETGQARRLDGRDGSPGFTNMLASARMPEGQSLAWNPGSTPAVSRPGLAWRLPKGSELVVELHLNRSGKPELVQSSVGLYFTEQAPTNTCNVFKLGAYALQFPAGASNVVVRDSMELPVDVDVLSVAPHAHYLARDIQGYAIRPDGSKEWLIWIRRWDFNWQGDYRYRKPIHLPKGTTLHAVFTYDNSTNNPANPNHPPREVVFGEQSSDEMCEFSLHVLPRSTNDLPALQSAGALHRGKLTEALYRQKLAADPGDAESRTRLGMVLVAQGRRNEAWEQLDQAVRSKPGHAEAHYNRGVFLRLNNRPTAARRDLEAALTFDPQFPKAHQQLGFALASLGLAVEAERAFQRALELDPTDTVARDGLNELRQILRAKGK